MTQDKSDDLLLESLFEEARANPPTVSDALMARIVTEAQAVQPRPARRGIGQWIAAVGGLPGLGGLVTATCVGFWLGFAPPEAVPDLAGVILGSETYAELDDGEIEVFGFGWDVEEGQADG